MSDDDVYDTFSYESSEDSTISYESSSDESSEDSFSSYAEDNFTHPDGVHTSDSDESEDFSDDDVVERVYPLNKIYDYLLEELEKHKRLGNESRAREIADWIANLD